MRLGDAPLTADRIPDLLQMLGAETVAESNAGGVADARAANDDRVRQVLRDAIARGETTKLLALRAVNAWRRLNNHVSGLLALPRVAVGEGGKVLFYWEDGDRYAEMEALPDRHAIELFCRDRRTKEHRGEDWDADAGAAPPDFFCQALHHFRAVR